MVHLPARSENILKREHDFKAISKRLKVETVVVGAGLDFGAWWASPELLSSVSWPLSAHLAAIIHLQCVSILAAHQHDHTWFFGDLNYRVELPFDKAVTLYKQRQFGTCFCCILAHHISLLLRVRFFEQETCLLQTK